MLVTAAKQPASGSGPWLERGHGFHASLQSKENLRLVGIMADAFNPSVRDAEASGFRGYSGLQSEFHTVRPCPKINKQKQKKINREL